MTAHRLRAVGYVAATISLSCSTWKRQAKCAVEKQRFASEDKMKSGLFILTLIGILLSSACGGGGGSSSAPPPPPTTFTLGGTVTGLSGTGLVLQNNGGNNLSVSGN